MGATQRRLRSADLLLIALAAPAWIPALGTIALGVLVTSGSPILFRQERVGRGGRTFSMYKFRSMRNGDNPLIPDPDRITPIGKFLRRTSLDELPQLLNVVEGSMSLVGPRPMLPSQQSALSETQSSRHAVRPGLTGLAQVNGRNALSWDERFIYDVRWAKAPSLRRYFSILSRTASTVLRGDGIDGHSTNDRVLIETDPSILDLDAISLRTEATSAPPLVNATARAESTDRP